MNKVPMRRFQQSSAGNKYAMPEHRICFRPASVHFPSTTTSVSHLVLSSNCEHAVCRCRVVLTGIVCLLLSSSLERFTSSQMLFTIRASSNNHLSTFLAFEYVLYHQQCKTPLHWRRFLHCQFSQTSCCALQQYKFFSPIKCTCS